MPFVRVSSCHHNHYDAVAACVWKTSTSTSTGKGRSTGSHDGTSNNNSSSNTEVMNGTGSGTSSQQRRNDNGDTDIAAAGRPTPSNPSSPAFGLCVISSSVPSQSVSQQVEPPTLIPSTETSSSATTTDTDTDDVVVATEMLEFNTQRWWSLPNKATNKIMMTTTTTTTTNENDNDNDNDSTHAIPADGTAFVSLKDHIYVLGGIVTKNPKTTTTTTTTSTTPTSTSTRTTEYITGQCASLSFGASMWDSSDIPPLLQPRCYAAAVGISTSTADILLVVGGRGPEPGHGSGSGTRPVDIDTHPNIDTTAMVENSWKMKELNSVEMYSMTTTSTSTSSSSSSSPSTPVWQSKCSCHIPRMAPTLIAFQDSSKNQQYRQQNQNQNQNLSASNWIILLIGGYSKGVWITSVEQYDMEHNTWTIREDLSLPSPICFPKAVVVSSLSTSPTSSSSPLDPNDPNETTNNSGYDSPTNESSSSSFYSVERLLILGTSMLRPTTAQTTHTSLWSLPWNGNTLKTDMVQTNDSPDQSSSTKASTLKQKKWSKLISSNPKIRSQMILPREGCAVAFDSDTRTLYTIGGRSSSAAAAAASASSSPKATDGTNQVLSWKIPFASTDSMLVKDLQQGMMTSPLPSSKPRSSKSAVRATSYDVGSVISRNSSSRRPNTIDTFNNSRRAGRLDRDPLLSPMLSPTTGYGGNRKTLSSRKGTNQNQSAAVTDKASNIIDTIPMSTIQLNDEDGKDSHDDDNISASGTLSTVGSSMHPRSSSTRKSAQNGVDEGLSSTIGRKKNSISESLQKNSSRKKKIQSSSFSTKMDVTDTQCIQTPTPFEDSLGNLGTYQGFVQNTPDSSSIQGSSTISNTTALIPHGRGIFVANSTGDIFDGEWTNGMRHGKGCWKFELTGDLFEGYFVNDQKHGPGLYQYRDGRCYEGNYANNLAEDSRGRLTWKNNTCYIGAFLHGQRTGEGEIYFPNNVKYVGGFRNGKYHGYGTMHFEDGKVYSGYWKRGTANGKGRLVDTDGTLLHDGLWEDDAPILPESNESDIS